MTANLGATMGAKEAVFVSDLLMHPRDINLDELYMLCIACNFPGTKVNPNPWVREGDTPESVASKVFGVSISDARRRGSSLTGPYACPHYDKWWVVKMGKKDRHPVFLDEDPVDTEDELNEYS